MTKTLIHGRYNMKRLLFLASTLTISFSLSMALVKEAGAYSFTSLDVPGATAAIAFGINDAGGVVGYYYDATVVRYGFTYDGSSYSSLNVPGAIETVAFGINDAGSVVGSYYDATGRYGFTYNGSSYSSLNVPGATATEAYGINDAGSVVGWYYDATGGYGFIATAQPGDPTYNASVPEPSTLLLLGSGFAGLAVFRKRFKE